MTSESYAVYGPHTPVTANVRQTMRVCEDALRDG